VDFIGAKGDESDGNKCSIRHAKLQSKCHCQQCQFFTVRMPFLSHNQQCHRAEGKTLLNIPSKYTISTILSSNKNHNRDVLVPAKPGPPGKLAVKMDRERHADRDSSQS